MPPTDTDSDAVTRDAGDGALNDGFGPRRSIAPFAAGAVLMVVIGLIVMLILTQRGDSASANTPLLNQPAPPAAGEFADGAPFDVSRRKGSWVVLNFFSPDCVPCIQEHPELARFVEQQRSIGTEGAEFYSIVQHASVEEVDAFFDRYGGDWPIVYDTEFEFQTGFGVAQVPETWIIDPNGVVRGRVIGRISTADAISGEIQRMRDAMAGS